MEISKKLASQIVTAIHEVVKKDINLIDASGTVIGSTDEKRIGRFHAAAAYAIENKTPVIVDEEHPFEGARTGINYPIFLENSVIAVIGITGDPEELHSYGFLITKITEVFLKEQKLNDEMTSQNRALHYLITSLINDNVTNPRQLTSLLEEYGINPSEEFSVLSIKLKDASLEPSLHFYFKQLHIDLSLYLYPNEWVTIFNREDYKKFNETDFMHKYNGKLFAGQGDFLPFHQISRSYNNALIARSHAKRLQMPYCNINDVSIEIILESLPQDIQILYADKLLFGLSEKELYILKTYLSQNLSLKQTSALLHIHKNTLQYQLDLITQKSGLNPRQFQDAFLLQFALLCRKK